MAIARFAAWSEGSLFRRTLLHVATFVLGSVAFLGLVSFVLVSIAKGILPQRGEAADPKQQQDEAEAAGPTGGKSTLPIKAGGVKKRKGMAVPTDEPAAEKDE
jgi:hypothetical protein